MAGRLIPCPALAGEGHGGGISARLPDGRLHLQHGPIDLIINAQGPGAPEAYRAAERAFAGVLETLVAELPLLRAPAADTPAPVTGPVARRMVAAVHPHREKFITPMAAVAGSVADHILAAMLGAGPLETAFVNNGGDIALHVAAGAQLRIGLVRSLARGAPEGQAMITRGMGVGGIATSGWPGRSFSRGIADAVTILARDAATADAAATVIANAVNVDHPAVRRAPARSLDPDSDLGERLVTVGVGALPEDVVALALADGARVAEGLRACGLIVAALLAVGDVIRVVRGGDVLGVSTRSNTAPARPHPPSAPPSPPHTGCAPSR